MIEVFAHEGGWDEVLYVATPLLLVAALLWVANRRASALDSEDDESDAEDSAD